MNKNIYLTSILFTYIIVLYVLISATGGIDIAVYKLNSGRDIQSWSGYEFKEIFSWLIIKFSFKVSSFFGLDTPFVILNFLLFLFFQYFLKGTKYKKILIVFALIGPFGVMLSLNVLRQYISLMFFFMAMINLYENNIRKSVVASFLAITSHASILPFVALLFSSYYFNVSIFYPIVFVVTVFPLSILSYIIQTQFGYYLSSTSNVVDVSGYAPLLKVIISELYLFVLFVLIKLKSIAKKRKSLFDINIEKLVNVLFIFSLTLMVSPFQEWVINRLIISIGFIFILLIFFNKQKLEWQQIVVITSTVIINSIALYFHPGARGMLSF